VRISVRSAEFVRKIVGDTSHASERQRKIAACATLASVDKKNIFLPLIYAIFMHMIKQIVI
jgi:hypothetical protein